MKDIKKFNLWFGAILLIVMLAVCYASIGQIYSDYSQNYYSER